MSKGISKGSSLTASAIRKLRNAAKVAERQRREAMNKANADVVKAREGMDDKGKLVQSVLRSSGAMRTLQPSMSRDRLKGSTYGQGFNGPRGFATPKGTVSKAEATPGRLVGRDASQALPAPRSKPFAIDGFTVPKGEGEGSVMRLSAPFKAKGTGKLQRRFMAMDLNESVRKPFDERAERMTDGNEYRARMKALRLK